MKRGEDRRSCCCWCERRQPPRACPVMMEAEIRDLIQFKQDFTVRACRSPSVKGGKGFKDG